MIINPYRFGVVVTNGQAMTLGHSLDALNRYMDIYFNIGVFSGVGSSPVLTTDLQISLAGGTATSPVISSVTNILNGALSGGESIVRVNFSYTGNADGTELVTIKPATATSINGDSPLLINTNAETLNPTYDALYQSVLSYAITNAIQIPVRQYRAVENQWVIDVNATGKWSTSDVIYRMSKYGDLNYACLNWKTPGTKSLIPTGGIVWAKGTGFTFGTTVCLDTDWTPSTDGVNFTLNSAGIFHAMETLATNNSMFEYGVAHTDANNSNRIGMSSRLTDGSASLGLNSGIGSTLGALVGASSTTFLNDRISSATTGHDFYVDGVLADGTNFASSALPNQGLIIGGRRIANGTIANQTTRKVSLLIAGGPMGASAADLHTAETTFVAALAAVTFSNLITTDDANQLTTDTPEDLTTD